MSAEEISKSMAESTYKMAAGQSALKACIFSIGVFDLAVSVGGGALQALVLQRISLHDDVVTIVVEFDVSHPDAVYRLLKQSQHYRRKDHQLGRVMVVCYYLMTPSEWAQFAESFGPSQIALTGFFLGHPSDQLAGEGRPWLKTARGAK